MNIARSTEKRSFESLNYTIITDQKLYRELMALRLEDGFVARLLKESGWSIITCHRVIEEYKRFLFLHHTATHRVVPSKMVDRVWHLHLLYTRSYWNELCGDILKAPLHHHPGNNILGQHDYFWCNYQATLKSYELIFHHCPPSDIWVSPQLQFSPTTPTIDYWQIPKPSIAPITTAFGTAKTKLLQIRLRSSHYATIAILSCVATVLMFRIDILTLIQSIRQVVSAIGFASTLKYACLVSSVISLIQSIPKTHKAILMADQVRQEPIKINPVDRVEEDVEKPRINVLTAIYNSGRQQIDSSMLAVSIALYIQLCQFANSPYLLERDQIGLMIAGALCGIGFGFSLSQRLAEFIEEMILNQLRSQKKLTFSMDFWVKHSLWTINNDRARVCKTCSQPISLVKTNIDHFLTEKELFAKRLDSIEISYRKHHCRTCSPNPSRDNLAISISPKNSYHSCPTCRTIARKTTITTTSQATTTSTGLEMIVEECAYCDDRQEQTRTIPKVEASCESCCD